MEKNELISYLNDIGIIEIDEYVRLIDEKNYHQMIRLLQFNRKEKLSKIHLQQNQLILLDSLMREIKEKNNDFK